MNNETHIKETTTMATDQTIKIKVDASETADRLEAVLENTKVPKRVLILNIVQLLGLAAAALAYPSPEVHDLLALLPAAISSHIGKIALVLLAAKPAINLVGDILDNGRIDKSWPTSGTGVILLVCIGVLSILFFP